MNSRTVERSNGRTLFSWSPPIPREHGAWAVLLIGAGVGFGAAGRFGLSGALFLLAALGFFLAQHPLGLAVTLGQHRRRAVGRLSLLTWTGLYGAVALAAGAALVWRAGPAWVIALGATVAALAAMRLVLRARHADRAIPARLRGIAGLALTAPGAYAAARGGWRIDAWALWFLVWAYFAGSLFLLRARLAARANDGRRQAVERWRHATLAYHIALFPVAGALAAAGVVPVLALLGLAPAAWRGVAVARRDPAAEAATLVGWREVACGLTFAALLILAYRLDGAVRAW